MSKQSETIDNETRERHLSFAQCNWPILAIHAYEQFLLQGKGLLLVEDSEFITKEPAIYTRMNMSFIPAEKAVVLLEGKGKEINWLKDYNPQIEIICTFIRSNTTGLSSYKIQGRAGGTQKELHEEFVKHDLKAEAGKQET